MKRAEADTMAKLELEAVFGVITKDVDLEDPADFLKKELKLKKQWTIDFVKQTENFYKDAQSGVIKIIPMKTYQKHRYGTGINVDLLETGELPEHRDVFTLNTPRILRH